MKKNQLGNLFKVKKSYIALIDQGMVSGINFLIGILLARNLGIYDFGVYSLIWMIVLFINSVQLSLITSPMMSIGPKQGDKSEYFSVTLLLQLFFAVLTFLLILLIGGLISLYTSQYLNLIFLVSFVSVSFQLQEFMRRYFFTNGKFLIAFFVDCINYLGQIGLLVLVLIYFKISIINVLLIVAICSILSFIFGFSFFNNTKISREYFLKILKRNWNYGSWLAVSNITQFIGSQGVMAIAGTFLSPSILGGIRALQNLIAPINVMILAIQNVIPIQASRILNKDGYNKFVIYLIKKFIPIVISIIFISITAIYFSNEIMIFIYGKEYQGFSKYIIYFAIYSFLGALIVPQTIYFRTIENTRPLALAPMIAAPISIGLTTILISKMYITAVFIGLISNQLIIFIILLFNTFNKSSEVKAY